MVVYSRMCILVTSVKIWLDPVSKFRSSLVVMPEIQPAELNICSLLHQMAFSCNLRSILICSEACDEAVVRS